MKNNKLFIHNNIIINNNMKFYKNLLELLYKINNKLMYCHVNYVNKYII